MTRVAVVLLAGIGAACAGAGPGVADAPPAADAQPAAGAPPAPPDRAATRAAAKIAADHSAFLAMLDAGRSKAAEGAAAAIARDAESIGASDPAYEVYAAAPLFALLRFGSWASILALPEPPATRPIAIALLHAARGVALAERRDTEAAAAERATFAAARVRVGAETRFGADLAQDVLNLAGFVLDGRFLEAKGDRDRALASWRAAVQADDILSGAPPRSWYHALRESLGGALLRAGRWQEAEQVLRAGLAKQPDNPRLLFGLSLALGAEHRPADSDAAREKFRSAWRHADSPLTLEDL